MSYLNDYLFARYKCEKMFNKLYIKMDLTNIKLGMKIIDNDFIPFIDGAKLALADKFSLAGTCVNLMVEEKYDPNDESAVITFLKATIYIPESTIKELIYRCHHKPWNISFCIEFIVRHEIGHVIDFSRYIGEKLIDCKKDINDYTEILNRVKSVSYDNSNNITLEKWKELNKTSIESNANNIANITNKEIEKFYKLMIGRKIR